jgi:mRNA-degrading endonuclease RelE of RelBE toxin-antitoxin system
MPSKFKILTIPSFDRELRKIYKKNKRIVAIIEKLVEILGNDPFNHSQKHNIKKLTNIKLNEGQWRIRSENYRLRYDIIGRDVVLYSIGLRKDIYR